MSAALCSTCAARLHGQREVGLLSIVLTAVALVAFGHAAARGAANDWLLAVLAGALLLGLAERYLALRLALDERLFDRLSQRLSHGDGAHEPAALAELDQALASLGLAPPAKAGRPLPPRIAGTLRLLRWHGTAVVLQLLLLASAGALA